MNELFKSTKFIIGFTVLVLFLQMFTNNKFVERFLMLVLFGGIITNYKKFIELLNNVFGGSSKVTTTTYNDMQIQNGKKFQSIRRSMNE